MYPFPHCNCENSCLLACAFCFCFFLELELTLGLVFIRAKTRVMHQKSSAALFLLPHLSFRFFIFKGRGLKMTLERCPSTHRVLSWDLKPGLLFRNRHFWR